MTKKLIPVILAGTTLLTGCFEEKAKETTAQPAAPAVSKEDAVAVVNGTYISKNSLDTLEKEILQRSHGQTFPKKQLLEELIQRELLVQYAEQKQLDKSPEFIQRLQSVRNMLLSQAALQNYINSNPVTDEEIKAEYDAKIGHAGTEYKARHILVKTEDEAKQIIKELKKGADFVELAKTKSTGPSGPNGGDLGWFTADRMVPPFTEAVIAMENGQFSNEPVQTQFGWHVILREDSRPQTPPSLDSVKEQIRATLQRQKIQSLIENLRKKGNVEILGSLNEENNVQPDNVTTESKEAVEEQPADDQSESTESPDQSEEQPQKKADDAKSE